MPIDQQMLDEELRRVRESGFGFNPMAGKAAKQKKMREERKREERKLTLEPTALDIEAGRQFGFDPNVERLGVLPYPRGALTKGSKVDLSDWVAPQFVYEAAKAYALPGYAAQGGDYAPEEVANMAGTVSGGGMAFGKIPAGALGMAARSEILSELKKMVREKKGGYGVRRVERAADEIKNLERLYTMDALKEAFLGDNAKALMTMNPKDFEKYATPIPKGMSAPQEFRGYGSQFHDEHMKNMTLADYLDNLASVKGGFADVPYLIINKEEQGLPLTPFISGHEGRHRSRALAKKNEETGLVQLLPRAELREPFPRRDQEEYIEALKKELGMTDNLVLPQKYNEPIELFKDRQVQRPAIKLPNVYAKGGVVKKNGSLLSLTTKGALSTVTK